MPNQAVKMTEDDFKAWRSHPVTKIIFDDYLERSSQSCKDEWLNLTWGRGKLDPEPFYLLKGAHDAVEQIRSLDFATLERELNDD